jgi:hypothetical protein
MKYKHVVAATASCSMAKSALHRPLNAKLVGTVQNALWIFDCRLLACSTSGG